MIILTKQINETLDAKKLQELTVVRTEQGTLSLVGRECGKEILNFSSMPISKKLTVAERDILMDDYIMPTITKHGLDLAKLIILMKDRSLTDDVENFKEDALKDHGFKLSRSSAYSHIKNMSEVSLYSISAFDELLNTDITLTYSVDNDRFSTRVSTTQGKAQQCVNMVKASEKILNHMATVLAEWKDKSEAMDVKDEHVKELQESMQIKCSL